MEHHLAVRIKTSPLISFDGTKLHPSLVNFYYTAIDNYKSYLKDSRADLAPVFVTFEDVKSFNDINNWTIDKIDTEIAKLTSTLGSEDKNEWIMRLKDVKGKTKVLLDRLVHQVFGMFSYLILIYIHPRHAIRR